MSSDQLLLISVEGPSSAQDAAAIDTIVRKLSERSWFYRTPQFVNETDPNETVRAGDAPALTLGAFLLLPGPSTSRSNEQRCLDDVEAFFAPFEEYARENGREFAVDLNDETIGWIEPTGLSAGLRRGLLDPWRDRIESM
jgi:hypothetical protein